jgi:hypothetical protein
VPFMEGELRGRRTGVVVALGIRLEEKVDVVWNSEFEEVEKEIVDVAVLFDMEVGVEEVASVVVD